MTFTLTEAEKQVLLHREDAPGLVTYEACPICGKLQWKSRQSGVPDDVQASIGGRPCSRCEEVSHRAPEIFEWVICVLKWKDRISEKAAAS